MKRKVIVPVYAILILGLGAANVHVAEARSDAATVEESGENVKWWGNWHWHKKTLYAYVRSSNTEAIRAANKWNAVTELTLKSSSSHTDLSLLRGAYGSTGWRGLASIKNSARDSHCSNGYCEIKHCHATLNTSYSGSAWRYEGTYCMELGHCFGLDHDTNNGCMNSSAMNAGTSNQPSSNNIREINARY